MIKSRRTDAVVALLILVVGIAIGAVYRKAYDDSGGPQDVPTREFGAAIAMACGHGFVNPGYLLTPALDEFLTNRRDRMSCSDLPAVIPPMQLNVTQGLYRYLMVAAALVWRVTGVSWRGLTPLYAAAYGLTLVAAYGLFRLGIGRVMSVAATAAFAVSAVHLQQLPFLRDYAKAPFMLASMLIMGRLAVGEWSTRRALGYAAAFGVVLGIGFGFRNDLLILAPPWIVVMFFATPGPLRANLKIKAACVAVSAAVFAITAAPILTAYSSGSNTGHVALLGLMSSFDALMGIKGSIYDAGYVYLDGYAAALIQSFASRQSGQAVVYLTRDYDRAAAAYLFMIARHFPADIFARAYASTMTVLELPFAVGAHVSQVSFGARGNVILKFYLEEARLLQLINGLGGVMAALTLVTISARHVRAALVLVVLLVYFAGYPALQFHVRHYFHLEFIAWWALAFLTERAVVLLWERPAFSWPAMRPNLIRAGVFAVSASALLAGTLMVLRVYQTRHAGRLLREAYFGADREVVETAVVPAPRPGRVLVAARGLWHPPAKNGPTDTAYLVAEFSNDHCDAIQIPTTFRYDARNTSSDFSHDVNVRMVRGAGPTRILSPVFEIAGWSRFAGIELPARERDCLTGIYRIKADRVPAVLLNVNAPPHWERGKLYQTLAVLESASDGEDALPRLYSTSAGHTLKAGDRSTPFVLKAPRLEYRNTIVQDGPGGSLHIAGYPDTPFSLVLVLNNQTLPAGSTVIARGEIARGGIALTLSREDNNVIDSVDVVARGGFEAAVTVPATGVYTVSLSNRVSGGWLEDRLPMWLVRAFGWIPRVRRVTDVTITSFGWLQNDAAVEQGAR